MYLFGIGIEIHSNLFEINKDSKISAVVHFNCIKGLIRLCLYDNKLKKLVINSFKSLGECVLVPFFCLLDRPYLHKEGYSART